MHSFDLAFRVAGEPDNIAFAGKMVFVDRLKFKIDHRFVHDRGLPVFDHERHFCLCFFAEPIAGERCEIGGRRSPFAFGDKPIDRAGRIDCLAGDRFSALIQIMA